MVAAPFKGVSATYATVASAGAHLSSLGMSLEGKMPPLDQLFYGFIAFAAWQPPVRVSRVPVTGLGMSLGGHPATTGSIEGTCGM